jgi:alpha-tubulin suppressor-like RCC1 family protein
MQVGALTTWSKVFGGSFSGFSITTTGQLYAWGQNISGVLGLGNTTNYSSPKQVGTLTTWLSVASGYGSQTISTKTDGTLWSWGSGTNGKLGLGNTTSYSSPKQVGSKTTWASATCGGYHGLAILA